MFQLKLQLTKFKSKRTNLLTDKCNALFQKLFQKAFDPFLANTISQEKTFVTIYQCISIEPSVLKLLTSRNTKNEQCLYSFCKMTAS